MIVRCDRCMKHYRLSDEKMAPRGVTCICKQCGLRFFVHANGETVPVEAAELSFEHHNPLDDLGPDFLDSFRESAHKAIQEFAAEKAALNGTADPPSGGPAERDSEPEVEPETEDENSAERSYAKLILFPVEYYLKLIYWPAHQDDPLNYLYSIFLIQILADGILEVLNGKTPQVDGKLEGPAALQVKFSTTEDGYSYDLLLTSEKCYLLEAILKTFAKTRVLNILNENEPLLPSPKIKLVFLARTCERNLEAGSLRIEIPYLKRFDLLFRGWFRSEKMLE